MVADLCAILLAAFHDVVFELVGLVVFMCMLLPWVIIWTLLLVLEGLLVILTFLEYVAVWVERFFDRVYFMYYYCFWLYD